MKARVTELEPLSSELQVVRNALEAQAAVTTQARAEAEQHAAKIAELERAAEHAAQERRETLALLDARTAALKAAEAFLTKVDDVPDGEVVQLAQRLNARIAKVAATIAASPSFTFGYSDGAVASASARALTRGEWLGLQLVAALRARGAGTEGPPPMLRAALQAGIVAYAQWLASSWDLDAFEPSGLLQGIYTSMRTQGALPSLL